MTRVIYQDRANTVASTLQLMADVYAEETKLPCQPIDPSSIPIAKLDALGRTITTDWLTPGGGQPTIVQEPNLSYPSLGLASNLALWGLNPADIFTIQEA